MTGGNVEFHILGRDAIRASLPMRDCIELMVDTMAAVSHGQADLPLRTVMPIARGPNLLAVMPGHLATPASLGVKVLCLFSSNPAQGLSSHTGVILLFDTETGQLRALLDAAEITALRTPAATAAASRALARPDAGDLALLGTGEQAMAHLDALGQVHRLRRVRLWGRDRAKAFAFAAKASSFCPVPIEISDSVREAVEGADLICTATAAREPILKGRWIAPGAHVSLVGASVQTASEIDVEGVRRARYFVDYRPSAMAQAGELKQAIDAGVVTVEHVLGEIGEVHLGRCKGRSSDLDITIYKSLGIAAQDLAAANQILDAASRLGQDTIATL